MLFITFHGFCVVVDQARLPCMPDASDLDYVAARRARLGRLSSTGQRIAYLCFGASVILFVIAFIASFPTWTVTAILALMAIGSIIFVPAIIIGYGVKSADAEDRGEKFGY